MAAGTTVRTTEAQRRLVLIVGGLVLGGLGVWWSLEHIKRAPGTGAELFALTALAFAAGLFSFVTVNPSGAIVVINPAVCFSFALLLSWGLIPAIAAQLIAVAALIWRRRVPALRGLLMAVQFAAAFAVAYGVLRLGGTRIGAPGRDRTSLREAAIVIAAAIVWLAVYTAFGYLLSFVGPARIRTQIPPPTGYGLLFNAALVLLSPLVAVTADINVAFASLELLPLYAVQRMARLSAERERATRLDPLTSLANRSMLRERFDRLVATYQQSAGPGGDRLALLLLDLDRFKHVNDALGHDVGDQLLTAVANRLTSVDVNSGLVARLGGDEFAVLARVPDREAANALGVRAVEALREPVTLDGLRVDVTASVGVALRQNSSSEDFAVLLRHADTAMYEAKRRGDAIAFYNNQADLDTPERLHLLADFREALQNPDTEEVLMHYQPQINFETGAIDGLEALLRWTHPVHGTVEPSTIIAIAEHTSVMHLLTERVIDSVSAQIAQWRTDAVTPRVAINISARDLYSQGIVERLRHCLEIYGLPPHQLQVEITESALMADPARARGTLRRIGELGIDISLDDFGTGFSSLQNLRRIPLAEIKIDQIFVAGMTQNRDDAAIVASTIDMAHALGLRAVAEGVADERTSRLLADLGCDLGQGWHLSRAVPGDQISALIAQTPSSANRPSL